VQWVHSYVVNDKVFCVYNATGEEIIREHGRRAGFPIDVVHQASTIINPTTA
jgi:hypothetical protein